MVTCAVVWTKACATRTSIFDLEKWGGFCNPSLLDKRIRRPADNDVRKTPLGPTIGKNPVLVFAAPLYIPGEMQSLTRRHFLRLTAGAVGGLIALDEAQAEPASFLPNCNLPPSAPGLGPIDIHSHIFNATDLQVERFLTRAFAAEFPFLLRMTMYFLGPILQAAGWDGAPDGKRELTKLKQFENLLSARADIGEMQNLIERHRKEGREAFGDTFAEQLRTPFGQRFLEAYTAYRNDRLAKKASLSASEQKLQQFQVNDFRNSQRLSEYLELEKQSTDIAQIYNFVHNFFQYRYINAVFLLENYGCGSKTSGAQGPGVFCTAMVDFDYGLDAGRFPPPTSLETQIEVAGHIAALSEGHILPFVAFDPWRHVYEGEKTLSRVVNAVEHGGSIGIKLYPPMGFAPYGNAKLDPKPAWPLEDFPYFGERLDRAMDALLSWCAKEQVPVLAHANPSNAADPSFKKLGSPENWQKALSAHPKLRVCFGHVGGECLLDEAATCEGASGWPAGFLQRFAEPAGENAYGDASYFEDVIDQADRNTLVKRLRALYTAGGELARRRIMYGSDWEMLAIESGSDLYFKDFETAMQQLESDFPGVTQQFFIQNAAQYLGLGPRGASRKRIDAFLARHEIKATWLDAPILSR